eukprot:486762_1
MAPTIKTTCLICVTLIVIVHFGVIIHRITSNEVQDELHDATVDNTHSIDCYSIVNEENIRFLDESTIHKYKDLKHNGSVYLASYSGSGNTMTRVLLEYTTNIWTGSIFGGPSYRKAGFKGQIRSICQHFDVMLIKVHPDLLKRRKSLTREMMLKPCFGNKFCDAPAAYGNPGAVFIVRDPWKAIFTFYQFYMTKEEAHTGHVYLNQWDREGWKRHLAAHAFDWTQTFEMMQIMDQNNFDYIVVKYENDAYHSQIKNDLRLRMQCIFSTLMANDYGRLGTFHRKKTNETIHLTIAKAYQYLIENHASVICNAWKTMQPFAERYSYHNIDGVHC